MLERVANQIAKTRRPATNTLLPRKPGIYAVYLCGGSQLLPYAAAGSLMYIGKSEESLDDRDLGTHFATGETGRSTLRRSIGAILKDSLGLTAIPRSERRTKQDILCFRFTDDGETLLTEWMLRNLEIAYVELDVEQGAIKGIEEAVIDELGPPLNLDPKYRRKNPYADEIMALRKACAREAAG